MSLISSFFVWLLEFWTFGVHQLCRQPGHSSRFPCAPVLWCFIFSFFAFLLIFWLCEKLLADQEPWFSWTWETEKVPRGRLARWLPSIPPILDTPALESRLMLWLPPEEKALPVLAWVVRSLPWHWKRDRGRELQESETSGSRTHVLATAPAGTAACPTLLPVGCWAKVVEERLHVPTQTPPKDFPRLGQSGNSFQKPHDFAPALWVFMAP